MKKLRKGESLAQLPKIYLDQNILQYDFEGKIRIPENMQVQYVYSDEHFREMSRWENHGFFNVLRRLRARKIRCILDSNNKFTDNGFLYDYEDPENMYKKYLETLKESNLTNLLFWEALQVFLNGNLSVTTPKEINKSFQEMLINLMDSILNDIGDDTIRSQYIKRVSTIGLQLEQVLETHKKDILPLERARK